MKQPEQDLINRIINLAYEIEGRGNSEDADGRIDYEEVSNRLDIVAAMLHVDGCDEEEG
jgi:hypothetical protein